MACQRCFNTLGVESMRMTEGENPDHLALCKRCRWELGKVLDFIHFYDMVLIPRNVLAGLSIEAPVNGSGELRAESRS